MPLTSLALQNAKPKEKPYKLSDGDGLFLLVQPSGRKLWRFRYRFAGKENTLALGPFPEIPLAAARGKRDSARTLIAEGKDPAQQKKLDKIAAATAANNTFGAIAEELLASLEESGAAGPTLSKNRWLLLTLAAPLAKRPIADITSAEILLLLKRHEKAGRRETAKRLRGAIGRIFRHAIATLRAVNDPTYALQRALVAPVVQHRPAIVDERELGGLMRSIDEFDGWMPLRAALQFLALTMVRPGEVRHMRRSEVIWPASTWRITDEALDQFIELYKEEFGEELSRSDASDRSRSRAWSIAAKSKLPNRSPPSCSQTALGNAGWSGKNALPWLRCAGISALQHG
jgi:hypothetical protein